MEKRSHFILATCTAMGLGIALLLLFGGEPDYEANAALGQDGGDELLVSSDRQSSLNLPEIALETAEVPRAVVPSPETTNVIVVAEVETPNLAAPSANASIQGYVSYLQDHLPHHVAFTVVGIDPTAKNLKVYRSLSINPDVGTQDGTHVTYAWELQDLIPGAYRITYDQTSIQGITLVPGNNDVFAVMGEPRNLELSFVDEITGEPVLGSQVNWANLVDDQRVGSHIGHYREQNLHCINGTGRMRGVLTERLYISVLTKGYARLTKTLFVSDGEKQVVALRPVCRLEITRLAKEGQELGSLKDQILGFQFSFSIGGQFYTAIGGGSSGGKFNASFDIPTTPAGNWELVLPDGLELISVDNCEAGPGQTINVTVR